jgi:hypoxanthine phosphoribosyltransferase
VLIVVIRARVYTSRCLEVGEGGTMLAEKLISYQELERTVDRVAADVAADLEGKVPVFICVLKGAVFFFTELTRRLEHVIEMDFVQLSSYGATTKSSGSVTLVKDITVDISGKDVYVVEDIVDTGLTLTDLMALISARHPRSVKVVALLSKPSRRLVDVTVDFVGIEIPDRFVVGFGLDFNEHYRNLPEVWEYRPNGESA